MKTPVNDGGSAFPVPPDDLIASRPGMTLRDYFAGQALVALVHHFMAAENPWDSYRELVESAYHMADAMLKEREK